MRSQHGGTPGSLELRASTGASTRLLVAVVVLLLFAWAMTRFPERADIRIIAWGSALLALVALPALLRELVRRGPLLVLSHAGLEDRRTKHGLIPWSEIAGVELVDYNREKFMMLRMRDPYAWQAKQSVLGRMIQPLNELLGFRGVPIVVSGLSMPPEQVVGEVRRRLQARDGRPAGV